MNRIAPFRVPPGGGPPGGGYRRPRTGRNLPGNLDYERTLLGALIKDNGHIATVTALGLRAEHFMSPAHRSIFASILGLHAIGRPARLITVKAALAEAGQLEDAGGTAAVSALTEGVIGSGSDVAFYAASIKQAARERALLRTVLEWGRRIYAGEADEVELEIPELVRRRAAELDGQDRFARTMISAQELLSLELERPRSLLGDGLIIASGFALLYGRPGLGKTWATLQLALAIARGAPWFGLPTSQARVAFLELELPLPLMQDRLRRLIGDSPGDELERFHLWARPALRGPVDLADPATLNAIESSCRAQRIELLIIDALSRVHTADENSAAAFVPVLNAIQRLNDSGIAVLTNHHEPKARDGNGSCARDAHLDAIRGTTRLQSDPQTLLRMWQTKGAIAVTAAKVNFGPTPPDIYLKASPDGPLEHIDAPPDLQQRAEENRAAIRAALEAAGEAGCTRQELEAAAGLKKGAVLNHLNALGATLEGKRYRL